MATFDWSVIPMRLVKPQSAADSEWVFEMRHKRWTARIAWDAADRALSRKLPQLHKALWVGRALLRAPQGASPRYRLGEPAEHPVRTALKISHDVISLLRRAPELSGGEMSFLARFMLFARVYHDKYYREVESHSGLEEAASLVVPWAAPISEALYRGAVREFPWLESAESGRQAEVHKDAVLRVYEELAMEAMAPRGIYPDLTEELCLSRRPCGQGASCNVYLARWNSKNGETLVAVKVFRIPDDAPNKSAAKLSLGIKDELDIWSRLDHPHILPLCGMHWIGGIPGLVSPWCANGDITKYVRDLCGPAKSAIALELLEQVALGLDYLHTHRPVVVHGDLKGANILISDDGQALLADFGLATIEAAAAETSPVLLPGTSAKGTYRWMAHELVIYDDAQLTRESDVWAFGCVLVEVLSGRVPFYEKTEAVQVILAISQGEIPSRPPGLHDRLWKLMLQCWRLVPSDRLCAGCILEEIRAFLASGELERSLVEGSRITGQ